MADLKICRICLCKGVKVYNYDRYNLKQYYEQLLCSKVNYKDGLPHYFCYMCATMLYKFHKFKEKCHTGQKTLKEMLWSGPLTSKTIFQIEKQNKSLQSSIDIINVSKRVKTYNVKSKSMDAKRKVPQRSTNDDNSNNIKDITENMTVVNDDDVQPNAIEEVKVDILNLDMEESTQPDIENDIIDEDNCLKSESAIQEESAVKDESSNEMAVDDDDNIIHSDAEIELEHDDDSTFSESEEKVEKKPVKKGKRKRGMKVRKVNKEPAEKGKKFIVPEKKWNYLDPEHWLKITLNEEEALTEFKSKAKEPRYLRAPYKCTDCLKGFSKEDIFLRHNKLKHSESVGHLECRMCKMRYKRKGKLAEHVTIHFTKYKCLRCEFVCPGKTAVFHNEYHNGVIRQCKYCGEEFRHSSSYYTHVRVKHRSEHICTICGASFVSDMGLRKHRKTMHIDSDNKPDDVNTYCERCDITFETRLAYQQHFKHSAKHSDIESLPKDTRAALEPTRRQIASQSRRQRHLTTCKLCNKNFPTQVAFLRHHEAEHENEPMPVLSPGVAYYAHLHTRKEGFNCYKCKKNFPTKGACLRHHAEVHQTRRYQYKDEEKHICEICGALLAPNSIATHLNTHTREKLYNCSICGLQLHSKSSLNRHELTHTGVKPFACPLCEKRFTQKCSMQLHYRTYHLKEPYPKRNRKKKTENPQDPSELEDIIMKEILKKP